MNRTLLAFIILLTYQAVPSSAQRHTVVIHNGFLKASDYLDMDAENQRAYAMGLLDGMYMAPNFGAPDNNKLLIKVATCVEGMKSSQVAAIIEKYVRDHPDHWQWDLKDMGYNAMLQAC